jgi:hypothetical protein
VCLQKEDGVYNCCASLFVLYAHTAKAAGYNRVYNFPMGKILV